MVNTAIRDAFASVTTPAELDALLQELEALAVETAKRIGHDPAAQARKLPAVVVPQAVARKAAVLLGEGKAKPGPSAYLELQRRCRQLKLPATGTAEVLRGRIAEALLPAQPASDSEPAPQQVEPVVKPAPKPRRKPASPKKPTAAPPIELYVKTHLGKYRKASVTELRRALAALEAAERQAA